MAFTKPFQLVFEDNSADEVTDTVVDPVDPEVTPVVTPEAQAEIDAVEVEKDDQEEIVYPDLADTETEKAAEDMSEIHDEAVDAAEEALNDTHTLTVALESLHNSYSKQMPNTRQLKSVQSLVIDIRTKQGYKNPMSGLNMESHSEPLDAVKMVMESIGSTLRSFWQALVNMFMRMVSLIKKFLMELFSRTKFEKERAIALSNAIGKQRKDNRKEISQLNAYIDEEKFVNLPLASRVLCVNGDQPTSYCDEFERLCDLAPGGKSFEVTFGESFSKKLETSIEKLTSGQDLDASDEAPSPASQAYKGYALKTHVDGIPPLPGMIYFVYPTYLSDFTIVQSMPARAAVDTIDSYDILQNWRTFVMARESTSTTGDMRNLSNGELYDATISVVKLADAVTSYKNSFNSVEKIEKALQKASSNFNSEAEKISATNPTVVADINKIIGSMNAVMRNVDVVLREYPRRCHSVLFAWNSYLKAIYIKEKDLYEKHNSV